MAECLKSLKRVYRDVVDSGEKATKHFTQFHHLNFFLGTLKKLCRMQRAFQDLLRWSGLLPSLFDACECLVAAAMRDVKLKSDYQDEINTFLKLLLAFLTNFTFNNKKNQV